MTRKGCPTLRWRSTWEQGGTQVRITAKGGGDTIARGLLKLTDGGGIAEVGWVWTNKAYRRCGVGTQLYERFLAVACEKGRRLASDTIRSDKSEGFWRKQQRKGRATCIEKPWQGDDIEEGAGLKMSSDEPGDLWPCGRYALRDACPANRSLAAIRKRKQRRRRRRRR